MLRKIRIIRDWYTLNKTQRRGSVFLLFLLLISLCVKYFYHPTVDSDAIYFANIILNNTLDSSKQYLLKQDSLFFFDPNVVGEQEMKWLGLPEKTIRQIINYRKSGGKFHSKEDLKKIYSMNDSLYFKLEPYIVIAHSKNEKFKLQRQIVITDISSKQKINVELNSADSVQLEKLSGIGKILAARIIKYRNRLGGFYSVTQLKEVYGIRDSLYNVIIQKNNITVDTSLIHKINIQTADFKALIRHPYFNKDIVVKILQMQRNKEIINAEKLKSISGEEWFEKIKYYTQF